MKALKVVLALIGALVVAAGVFYVGWLTPPDPAAVCDNVIAITAKEAGREPPATLRATCMESATTKPQFGLLPWVKQLKCLRDAKDKAGLDTCYRM